MAYVRGDGSVEYDIGEQLALACGNSRPTAEERAELTQKMSMCFPGSLPDGTLVYASYAWVHHMTVPHGWTSCRRKRHRKKWLKIPGHRYEVPRDDVGIFESGGYWNGHKKSLVCHPRKEREIMMAVNESLDAAFDDESDSPTPPMAYDKWMRTRRW